jgi:hypothetical protein
VIKIKTQNVSLPIDLHEWVVKKMEETKASTPWAKVTFSSVVEHALLELRKSEQGKVVSPGNAGAKTPIVSESSASSRSTATRNISRRAG